MKYFIRVLVLLILGSVCLKAADIPTVPGPDMQPLMKDGHYVLNDDTPSKMPDKVQAISDIKIIIFNNFINQNNAVADKLYIDSAYVQHLLYEMDEYKNMTAAEPFAEATFTKYNNFKDVNLVIFPLNDYDFSTLSPGKAHSVINTIRDLMKAGKQVLVTSRTALALAFEKGVGSDLGVQKFMTDTLGINYFQNLPVSSVSGNTTTIYSYSVRGAEDDPIGQSIHKFCNMTYDAKYELWYPLAYYLKVNTFKTRDKDKFPPTDVFIWEHEDIRHDTLTGIRAEWGNSRIAFWSMGFEAFAGKISRDALMERAVRWLLEKVPSDKPQILLNVETIDFGHIKLDSLAERTLTIKNTGKTQLKITDISMWDNDEDAFTIKSGGASDSKPVLLNTGQTHDIVVTFKPESKKQLNGTISIISNSEFRSSIDFGLTGWGGEEEISGSQMIFNVEHNVIDFGTVSIGLPKTFALKIKNKGASELEIKAFKITQADDDAFTFPHTMTTPFYIQAGDSISIDIRFGGRALEKVYKGTLHIESNDAAHTDFDMTMLMNVSGAKMTLNIPNDTVDFGNVKPGDPKTFNLKLTRGSNSLLYIYSIAIAQDENDDHVFSIANTDNISLPDSITSGDGSIPVDIKFEGGTTEKIYKGKLHIESSDPNKTSYDVKLVANVTTSEGVSDLDVNLPDVKVTPNPASDKFAITCNTAVPGNLSVGLLNMDGSLVKEIYTGTTNGEYSGEVSTNGLSSGVYFVIFKFGNTESKVKVVINK